MNNSSQLVDLLFEFLLGVAVVSDLVVNLGNILFDLSLLGLKLSNLLLEVLFLLLHDSLGLTLRKMRRLHEDVVLSLVELINLTLESLRSLLQSADLSGVSLDNLRSFSKIGTLLDYRNSSVNSVELVLKSFNSLSELVNNSLFSVGQRVERKKWLASHGVDGVQQLSSFDSELLDLIHSSGDLSLVSSLLFRNISGVQENSLAADLLVQSADLLVQRGDLGVDVMNNSLLDWGETDWLADSNRLSHGHLSDGLL